MLLITVSEPVDRYPARPATAARVPCTRSAMPVSGQSAAE